MVSFYIAIGVVVGCLMGLLGIGGGVLLIPALVFWAGFSQTKATGTTLAVLLPPVGLLAALEYYRHGQVDMRAALFMALGVFAGAWVGALAANRIPKEWLKLGFGVFIIGMGFWMVFDALGKLRSPL